jgi:hypothetical protein
LCYGLLKMFACLLQAINLAQAAALSRPKHVIILKKKVLDRPKQVFFPDLPYAIVFHCDLGYNHLLELVLAIFERSRIVWAGLKAAFLRYLFAKLSMELTAINL